MTEIFVEEPGAATGWLSALAAAAADGRARQQALRLLQETSHTPTTTVTYTSRGSVLVIGAERRAADAVEALQHPDLRCTVLLSDPAASGVSVREGPNRVDLVTANVTTLLGHLGGYVLRVRRGEEEVNLARLLGHQRDDFDLVADVGVQPQLAREVLPPGYFAPRDQEDYNRMLEQIPQLVGEFDKPRYFRYDPDLCAHGASGFTACTRCLDSCPTDAISSLAERIEVDQYLCQGGGICATACPSGAITYVYPQVSDLLDDLRRLLHRYHDAGGRRPQLMFYDPDTGAEALAPVSASLPENLIPFAVEEIGSVGMDVWLSALAYGAHQVLLLLPPEAPQSVIHEIDHQRQVAAAVLEGMGYPGDRIQLLRAADAAVECLLPAVPDQPLAPAAGFAGLNEKRTTVRLAADHLYEHATRTRKSTPLPVGSPFGQVRVDRDACTLCMACASVCPARALFDGDELPRLIFTEQRCLQCGMCDQACPEDAITLQPRFLYRAEERGQQRVLNEEEPFNCISCGKPFATRSMMDRMREKLKGHWMFQDPEQMRRLEMCENCRVEDMFVHGGGVDPYAKPEKPTDSEV